MVTLEVLSWCLMLAIIGRRSSREAGGVEVVQLLGHVSGRGKAGGFGGWEAEIGKKPPGAMPSTCAESSFPSAAGLGLDLQTLAK